MHDLGFQIENTEVRKGTVFISNCGIISGDVCDYNLE
jgi:hypothetical protein